MASIKGQLANPESEKWGSISLRGELELGKTTAAVVGTPAARSLSSGGRSDGGLERL